MPIRAYLAGPDVFLPDAKEVGARKVAICRQHGIEAHYPLDVVIAEHNRGDTEAALAISRANEALIEKADVVFANLTPFRSPSADVGTVYEIGYAHALRKAIFGYSADSRGFRERVLTFWNLPPAATHDEQGVSIEDFNLVDNLMIDGAVLASGGAVIRPRAHVEPIDLAAFKEFELAVRAARDILHE